MADRELHTTQRVAQEAQDSRVMHQKPAVSGWKPRMPSHCLSEGDWSCFVSHRLSVINQKVEDKSISKESQNRYSKSAKDWGWREFVTLTTLFDQEAGFLIQDTVVFSAEVLILKESVVVQELSDSDCETCSTSSDCQIDIVLKRPYFTWKVENFMSFKDIMETRKIFSKYFQAGGCELRIGVYESFDTLCIYLESDQSSGNDPEKNFWVHYKMAIVNQKNSEKTIWKESSICTKTWNNSVLQFMKVAELIEPDAGFLVRDTVVFICEVVDCCPWFEFSDLEVLAFEDEPDALSMDEDDHIEFEESEEMDGDDGMIRNLLWRAGFSLTYGENYMQPLVTLRENILTDASAIAGFLTGLRLYLNHPEKVKRMLLPAKTSGEVGEKKDCMKSDASSASLINLLMGVSVLKDSIIDLLLDLMVECCQPSEAYLFSMASSKSSPDVSEASSQPENVGDAYPAECACHNIDGVLPVEDARHSLAVQSLDSTTDEAPAKICPPETSATDLKIDDCSDQACNWPEQSEELLVLIVNSLMALDNTAPQGCCEPKRRPHSVQKIAIVLDKAPKCLHPDLISLVPKIVDCSEHSLAASVLLDFLQKPAVEPSFLSLVFDVLCQLEIGNEVLEKALSQALESLVVCNDEPLIAVIGFLFKAASPCRCLLQSVTYFAPAVRSRLKCLGAGVSDCVLEFLTRTVCTQRDVAVALLKDIDADADTAPDSISTSLPGSVNGLSAEGLSAWQEQAAHGIHNFSDVYMLIDILRLPGMFVKASQVLERGIMRGTIVVHLVAAVLERRHIRRFNANAKAAVHENTNLQDGQLDQLSVEDEDFTAILAVAEVLSLSTETKIQDFLRMLYAIMFKIYVEDHFRYRILKGLVERSTNSADNCRAFDVDMDVLVYLVQEEPGVARPVLNMLREIVEVAQVDHANLWHQICTVEDENVRLREESETELMDFSKKVTSLLGRLGESEATISRLKTELKAEADCFAREKKELYDQKLEIEKQLDWLRSEKDEQIAKLSADRRSLQDRLHNVETQFSELKSRKQDELKKVVKEKNVLAERLKSAESLRKRFDEELKRCATESVSMEEAKRSVEDELLKAKQLLEQTKGEVREKEAQVSRCEAYIDGMESKLRACQQYISTLEASVREEMSRHAPLYGVGVEALSMKELDTLARIHEDGLRQVRLVKQRKGGNNLLTGHSLSSSSSSYPSLPLMAVGHQASASLKSSKVGHISNGVGPWYNPT